MVILRKEHFLASTYSKLNPRKYDQHKILQTINDNAYAIDLPEDIRISKTFNVADLHAFYEQGPFY